MRKLILIFFPIFLFASIKTKIIHFYKKYYPNIKIEKIKIYPTPPKKYKKIVFYLSPKRSFGNIKINNKFYYIVIKAKIPVCITTQIIRLNEGILNKCKIKLINFRNFYAKPIIHITPNLVASTIIAKDSIINTSNVKPRPLVFKNSTVSVIIQSKNIIITSSAKALQDGYKGNEIRIFINNKIKIATVIGKELVKIP